MVHCFSSIQGYRPHFWFAHPSASIYQAGLSARQFGKKKIYKHVHSIQKFTLVRQKHGSDTEQNQCGLLVTSHRCELCPYTECHVKGAYYEALSLHLRRASQFFPLKCHSIEKVGAGDVTQLVECSMKMHKAPSFIPNPNPNANIAHHKTGHITHVCMWEVQGRGLEGQGNP